MPRIFYSYAFLLGIIGGLSIGFFYNPALFFAKIYILVAFICFMGIIVWYWKKHYIIPLLFILVLIGSLLGFWRAEQTIHKEKPTNHIIHHLDKKAEVKGIISREVDIRADKINYIISLQSYNDEPVIGNILVQAQKYPQYQYGDILQITGTIKEPPENDDFSYKEYLSRYEVYGMTSYAKLKKTGKAIPSKNMAWILTSKQWFLSMINKQYHEPYAAFLAGLLIGDRKGMDEDVTEDFRVTGLAHIVAVSGSNITLILAIIITLFGFLPRMLSVTISVITIIAFTIFVGMSAAVVRAAIMGLIGLAAVQLGRPSIPLMAMLLTIVAMAWYQPKVLFYDVGFQLSVSAVIGVIWLVPLMPEFFQKLPESFGVKEAIALTLAAQITTLPVSIYHFGAFSLIAPLANLFVVPTIPFAMLFGFLSLVPIPFVSDVLVAFTTMLLQISLLFAEGFAAIPYAQLTEIVIQPWQIFMYFVLLILFFLWKWKQEKVAENI